MARSEGWQGDQQGAAPLVAVPSGTAYRVDSPPDEAQVTATLANELKTVLESFASDAGFSDRRPLRVFFRRGTFGHHRVGRAADIYAVGGIGLDAWKRRWDAAHRRMDALPPAEARRALETERRENLGWRLYRALAARGRWAHPYGYPIQLFGPWTRSDGPWKYISDRLLHAHRDHIHVAK